MTLMTHISTTCTFWKLVIVLTFYLCESFLAAYVPSYLKFPLVVLLSPRDTLLCHIQFNHVYQFYRKAWTNVGYKLESLCFSKYLLELSI